MIKKTRTLIAIFLTGIFFLPSLSVAKGMSVVMNGIPHQAFFGIDFEGQTGMVVGAAGDIYESSDGGRTWDRVGNPPTRLSLLDVNINKRHYLAVGQMGVVLRKTGTSDWELVQTDTEMRLLAVDQNETGLAVTVGQFGTILLSRDHGESWVDVRPEWSEYVGYGFEPQLYDVHIDSLNKITIVGEFGIVLQSSDQGETWELRRKGESDNEFESSPSLWALTMTEEGTGYAVGQEGILVRTLDGGETWETLNSATDSNLQDVYIASNGDIYAVGIRELIRSTNSGKSWQKFWGADIATGWYQKIGSPGNTEGVLLVGHHGRIVHVN